MVSKPTANQQILLDFLVERISVWEQSNVFDKTYLLMNEAQYQLWYMEEKSKITKAQSEEFYRITFNLLKEIKNIG